MLRRVGPAPADGGAGGDCVIGAMFGAAGLSPPGEDPCEPEPGVLFTGSATGGSLDAGLLGGGFAAGGVAGAPGVLAGLLVGGLLAGGLVTGAGGVFTGPLSPPF